MGLRGDAIAQFDWSVGKIMEALHEMGLSDNTLVILTSDNGPVIDDGYQDLADEKLGSHKPAGPFRGTKYSAFEGGTAVPFIVSWPSKIAAGQQSNALVSQIDLLSSMAGMLNARLPKGSATDSENAMNVIMGIDKVGRQYVIEQSLTHVLSVRTPQWKYIEPNDGEPSIEWAPKVETGNYPAPQLYNMRDELYERKNVAEKYPEQTARLANILQIERNKFNNQSTH